MEDPKANPPTEKKPFDYVGLVQGKRSEGTVMAKTETEAAEHLRRLGVQAFTFKGLAVPKPPAAIVQAPPVPATQPPVPPAVKAIAPSPAQQAQVVIPPAPTPTVPLRPQRQVPGRPSITELQAAAQQAQLAARKSMLHNHSCTCGCQNGAKAKGAAGGVATPWVNLNEGVKTELVAAHTGAKTGRRQTVIVGNEKTAMERVEELLSKSDGKVIHVTMSPDCHGQMCFVFVVEHNQ